MYGGVVYGEKARNALSGKYDLEVKNISSGKLGSKYLKPLEWLLGMIFLKGKSDLWVRDDFYSIALQSFSQTQGKRLSAVYHIDSSTFPFFLKSIIFLIEKTFYWQIKKSDAILTIADYWKNHFLEKGCKNVYKISPAFNLPEFNVTQEEAEEFKKEKGLIGKPIIYLGNCQKAKGALKSYEALRGLDAYFVTSGREQIKIPAFNFNSDYRDYLKLLKASSVVLTMSLFNEGWCMTAHEAMLLGIPVIGSGKGGMEELLAGGKQIICKDFNQLRKNVESLLLNEEEREKMGREGREFAEQFTIERFDEEWLKMASEILS